jgi:HAD superfamily hydrolase (TIGR01509 family)
MVNRSEIESSIENFLFTLNSPFKLKGIFFDMDGVLFNSMPFHVKAWSQVFADHDFPIPEEEMYLNEGSTALFTVRKMYKKYRGEDISESVAEAFKVRKHKLMESYPESEVMPSMVELLNEITLSGIDCWVVTGSAQNILLDRLEKEFPGSLNREKMVTAFDVKIGKPNPEPYLKALEKSGFDASQVIVIENAPMGVESAKAAGLFVIAINTGPLNPLVLKEAGADIVLSGSRELAQSWPLLAEALSSKQIA